MQQPASQQLQADKMSKPPIDPKQALEKTLHFLNKAGFAKQLASGTATGWLSGLTAGLAGKTVALAVGGGVILFEIAQYKGLTKMNWDSVKSYAAEQASKVKTDQAGPTVSKMRSFAGKNRAFTAGFVGGFLLGIAF